VLVGPIVAGHACHTYDGTNQAVTTVEGSLSPGFVMGPHASPHDNLDSSTYSICTS
jgi:hypothetical protein